MLLHHFNALMEQQSFAIVKGNESQKIPHTTALRYYQKCWIQVIFTTLEFPLFMEKLLKTREWPYSREK